MVGRVGAPRAVEGGDGSSASDDLFYYRCPWETSRDENERHLNGVFLARVEHLRAVHGYDERIATYGWDDSDLYSRLERAVPALKYRPMDAALLSHIKHGDDFRGVGQQLVAGPTLETQINSLALSSLPAWETQAGAESSTYTFALNSIDGRFASATVLQTPRPLLDRLTPDQRERVLTEARDRLLHDVYAIPWSVLSEINRSRAELVRRFSLFERSPQWARSKGVIFAEVRGSVADRMVAIASAYGTCP